MTDWIASKDIWKADLEWGGLGVKSFNDFLASEDTQELWGGLRFPHPPSDFIGSESSGLLVVIGPVGVTISSIDVSSSTQIRINFSVPVLDNPALVNTGNYQTAPSLTIVSVTPETGYVGPGPTYVDIVTSEQLDGQSYTLTIHNVEEAS